MKTSTRASAVGDFGGSACERVNIQSRTGSVSCFCFSLLQQPSSQAEDFRRFESHHSVKRTERDTSSCFFCSSSTCFYKVRVFSTSTAALPAQTVNHQQWSARRTYAPLSGTVFPLTPPPRPPTKPKEVLSLSLFPLFGRGGESSCGSKRGVRRIDLAF